MPPQEKLDNSLVVGASSSHQQAYPTFDKQNAALGRE
jgi:hypothetical protein